MHFSPSHFVKGSQILWLQHPGGFLLLPSSGCEVAAGPCSQVQPPVRLRMDYQEVHMCMHTHTHIQPLMNTKRSALTLLLYSACTHIDSHT